VDYTFIYQVKQFINEIEKLKTDHRAALPKFLKPFHFATLAAYCRKSNTKLDLNHEALSYAVRMGLFEAIDQEPPVTVNRHSQNGNLIEATAVVCEDTIHKSSINISEMFANCAKDKETISSIEIMMAELLGNCVHHSTDGSDTPFGLVCGQAWQNGGIAQICIADKGIGIRESLAGNPELQARLESSNSCEMACEYGITGKPLGNHSGYGLAVAKGLAKNFDGKLLVVSGHEIHAASKNQEKSSVMDCPWDGTFIIFEWNLNIPLNVTSVYDTFPTSDTLSEDDLYDIFS